MPSKNHAHQANSHSRQLQLPIGLPRLLRGLTRAILKENPVDINQFGKYKN